MSPNRVEIFALEISNELRHYLDNVKFSKTIQELYDNLETLRNQTEYATDNVTLVMRLESVNEE